LDGVFKGKRLPTGPGHKLEDNIEMYLAETEWGTVRYVKMAEVWISGGLSNELTSIKCGHFLNN